MAGKAAGGGMESSCVSDLRNSSCDSIQDEFCSPNKSSVEYSIQYLHQVRNNGAKIHLDKIDALSGTTDVGPARYTHEGK